MGGQLVDEWWTTRGQVVDNKAYEIKICTLFAYNHYISQDISLTLIRIITNFIQKGFKNVCIQRIY